MVFGRSGIKRQFFGYAGGVLVLAAAGGAAATDDFGDFRRSNSFAITSENIAEVTTHFSGEDGHPDDTAKTYFDFGMGTYCRNAICAPFGFAVKMTPDAERFFRMIHGHACQQAAAQSYEDWSVTVTDGDGREAQIAIGSFARARHGQAFYQKHCMNVIS